MANSTYQMIEDCEATNTALYKFYAAVMIVIFILALPLNASVLHLFVAKLKFWKSNTNNIFLFNLVLADILLLFCLPIKAHNFIKGERRSVNDTVCKAMLFMLFLNRGASIAFLTVTSIDRYFNVVHPGRKNLLRALKKSPQISILIWLFLLPLTIPTMLKTFECCNSHKNSDDPGEDTIIKDVVDSLREAVFFTQIVIPFIILVYCTVRITNRLRKKTVGDGTKLRRAVRLVISVMVVFSFCFLPCAIARMVLLITRVHASEYYQDKAAVAFDGLMVLSYMDCLLDPLVYCFCSTKFKALYLSNYFPCLRSHFPALCARCCCCCFFFFFFFFCLFIRAVFTVSASTACFGTTGRVSTELRHRSKDLSQEATAEITLTDLSEESVDFYSTDTDCKRTGNWELFPGSAATSQHLNMSTLNSTIDHCRTPNPVTYEILSWVMVGEFLLGLPLNLSVLYIFIFRFKFWKNKSIFLFNIVVADFLLVVCLPAKAYHYQHNLRRSQNNVVCKTMLFMLFLNRGASIAFLITLSIDRYFNVVHLGRRNFVKILKKSPQISIVIWLLLLPLTIPTMVRTFECCNSHGRQYETYLHDVTDTFREIVFFTQIIIPFVVLVYCTVRIVNRLRKKTVGEKTKLRRAMCVVMSVVVVFSICFLPCAVARVVLLCYRLRNMQDQEDIAVQVYDSLMVLSYMDCLLDPLVYCFCNSGFKDAYISTFCPGSVRDRLLRTDFGLGTTTTTTTTTTTSGTRTISVPIMEK
ncbi:uncharacterized protein V6R79_024012 [Siganus canaliculatus]